MNNPVLMQFIEQDPSAHPYRKLVAECSQCRFFSKTLQLTEGGAFVSELKKCYRHLVADHGLPVHHSVEELESDEEQNEEKYEEEELDEVD